MVLAFTAPAEAKVPPLFGFNDDASAWLDHSAFAVGLGANVARVPVGWNADPASVRPLIDQLRSQGLRPLLLVWGNKPPALDAFAEACAAWAKAYPDALIQIWNEPSHHAFGAIDNPTRAAKIVSAGALAIREASPQTTIIGPGLAPTVTDGLASKSWRWYFNGLYRELPRRIAVGLHIFPYSSTPMRTLSDFYRRATKWGPVYVTEIGFFGNSYGDRQAQVSAQGYRKLVRLGARAIVYHRLAPAVSPGPWERAASMSVTDDPQLASALSRARARPRR